MPNPIVEASVATAGLASTLLLLCGVIYATIESILRSGIERECRKNNITWFSKRRGFFYKYTFFIKRVGFKTKEYPIGLSFFLAWRQFKRVQNIIEIHES